MTPDSIRGTKQSQHNGIATPFGLAMTIQNNTCVSIDKGIYMIADRAGRVWKFGDHVDTDVMTSGKYLNLPMDEIKTHVFESIRPEFSRNAKPGDIVVAGRNFGCGSSRETAPAALKALCVGAVLAESFARIFYRNAIAIGLLAIACPGISEVFADGDCAEVHFMERKIFNSTSGGSWEFSRFPDEMLKVLECGGIEALLKKGMKGQA
jgi:3-isopropylmalate/(R)-2-methylmalate dehydratase small subunit